MNKIIVINGPTAVGKSTIIKGILGRLPQLRTGVTFTTRPERRGQSEDKVMHYISKDEFEQKIRDREFLEWAEFSGHYYGSPKKENIHILEKHPLLMNIEVKGSLQIKELYPDSLLIYILPESLGQIKERLERREMSQADFDRRMQAAEWSVQQADKYDYQVTNRQGLVDYTIDQIVEIIKTYCDL